MLLRILAPIAVLLIALWYTILSLPIVRLLDKILYGVKGRKPDPALFPNDGPWTHGYVSTNGIKLHYVAMGDKTSPLMLFLHGFPESYYSWRHQIQAFSSDYYCVAIDMRGYNLSEKPAARSSYSMSQLVEDVRGVIEALAYGNAECVLVAHDWGGAVAWSFVYKYPEMVKNFIVMNLPHPKLFLKNFQSNEDQIKRSWYIFYFQLPFIPEWRLLQKGRGYVDQEQVNNEINQRKSNEKLKLGAGKFNPKAGTALERVFFDSFVNPEKSDLEEVRQICKHASEPGAITAMVNYYRNMFTISSFKQSAQMKKGLLKVRTLMIWGEKDVALGKELTVGTEKLVEDFKIDYIPNASHWVQQDAPEQVNASMKQFLGVE